MNLIANPEIQSSALAMMPRASYLKHYRLKDTASSTHDVHSQLFEFQYIQRSITIKTAPTQNFVANS